MGNCYYCNRVLFDTDDEIYLNPLRCIDCHELNELDKVRFNQYVDYTSKYWLNN